MKKKIFTSIHIAIIAFITLPAIIAFAAYSSNFSIVNTSTTDYGITGISANASIQDAADLSMFDNSEGLDCRVYKGATEQPFALYSDRVSVATNIPASSSTTLTFNSGNSLLSAFCLIPGRDGNITTSDAPGIEFGDNFTHTLNNYYINADTTTIFEKEEAIYCTYDTDSDNITVSIFDDWIDSSTWVSPSSHSDPDSQWTNEANAYDGNIATYAEADIDLEDTFDDTLYLYNDATYGETVRIYLTREDINISKAEISVFYSDAWHIIENTSITVGAYWEIDVGSTETINATKLRFWNSSPTDYYIRVHDYDVNEAEISYSASVTATSVEQDEHDINVLASTPLLGLGIDNSETLPITENLTLNLPLHHTDMTGTTITSKDENELTGTVTGATWGTQGRTFDGDDDINVGSPAVLDNLSDEVTLLAWVKPTSFVGSYPCFLSKGYPRSSGGSWMFYGTSSNIVIHARVGDNSGFESSVGGSLTADVWSMVTWTNSTDGNFRKLYKDITEVDSDDAITGGINVASTNLYVGYVTASNNYFNGIIGEVLIYNRALSQTEITNIYDVTKWRYDDTVPASTPSDEYLQYVVSPAVPDTANDLIHYIPAYCDSIELEISGTQKLLYEPDTILQVTDNTWATLPDESGNSNTGNITLGSLPSGVTTLLSSFTSDYEPTYINANLAQDSTPVDSSHLNVVELTDAQMETNLSSDIMYPIIQSFVNDVINGYISILQVYQLTTIMICMIVFVGLLLVPAFGFNMSLASLIVCTITGIAVTKDIFYSWILILVIPVLIFFIVTEGRRLVG